MDFFSRLDFYLHQFSYSKYFNRFIDYTISKKISNFKTPHLRILELSYKNEKNIMKLRPLLLHDNILIVHTL